MKVLLVTEQYVDIRPDGCYCNYALLGTLKNMGVIGELYIVAAKITSHKAPAQPINQKIDFVTPDRVYHFKPITSSISEFLSNVTYNRNLLDEVIPQMDLVIGYAPGHNLGYALGIAKKYKVPFITFLVACPWDSMHNHQRLLVRLLAPFYFLKTRYIVRKSDYVHYVTSEFLQRRYPTGAVSLGCSDTNLGELNPMALSNRLEKITAKGSTEEVKLITVAHIDVKFKGQEYVIKAIADFVGKGINKYHYYLVGAGEGVYLRELCKKLHVEEYVHFLGRKKPEEVMSLLEDSDIYLQPSLQEGLPRAVVEAMSKALPCIGFKTGGIPELLEPEFIVKRKDVHGIASGLQLLDDIDLYKKTAVRNFNKAKEYEHSFLTSRIQEFFRDIRQQITDLQINKTKHYD